MTIKANCKINIGLDVIERRADGFHELSTVMFPVQGLYDILDIKPIEGDEVVFKSEGLIIDCPAEHNLCIKAYNLMKSHYPAIGAVQITLNKIVPFGAGLGGGSSDATAVLLALNAIYNLSLSGEQLIDLAAQLGSDTAFFVRNTPQICKGRGEIMKPVDIDLSGKCLMLIKPDVKVSTREAYSGVKPAVPQESLSDLIALPVEEWQGRIKNDFEPHIFKSYPILGEIKATMLNAGAIYSAMSGSGSTILGIFDSEETAKSEQLRSYSPYIFAL